MTLSRAPRRLSFALFRCPDAGDTAAGRRRHGSLMPIRAAHVAGLRSRLHFLSMPSAGGRHALCHYAVVAGRPTRRAARCSTHVESASPDVARGRRLAQCQQTKCPVRRCLLAMRDAAHDLMGSASFSIRDFVISMPFTRLRLISSASIYFSTARPHSLALRLAAFMSARRHLPFLPPDA